MDATNLDLLAPGDGAGRPTEPAGLPASRLGGARLLRPLGTGGMGTVYLAIDEARHDRVAVKVLSPDLARSTVHVRRFEREGRSGRALDHPNVVRCLDFGQDATTGLHYLVLEYVDGGTAQGLLDRRGRLDVGEVVAIGVAVARALEYAHRRGIVHRDVKPENVFLTRDGGVKLGDLGLAKQLDDPAGHLTATRQAFGTALYMPYEQAVNARYADHRSDVYALGGTLYHLLTGHVPFPGRDVVEVFRKKRQGDFAPVRAWAPETPPALAAVIARMLAADPRDRPEDAAELLRALDATGIEPVPPRIDGSSGEIAVASALTATEPDLAVPAEEPWWRLARPAEAAPAKPAAMRWWPWFAGAAGLVGALAFLAR